MLRSSLLLPLPLVISASKSFPSLQSWQHNAELLGTTSNLGFRNGAIDIETERAPFHRPSEPVMQSLRKRFNVLSPEQVERERQRRREHEHEQETRLAPERDPSEVEGPSGGAHGLRSSRDRPPTPHGRQSIDIVHHPPSPRGHAAEHAGGEVTTSLINKARQIQQLTFRRDHRHRYLVELSLADTATVVLRGTTAWLMFDVIHWHRDAQREARFLLKLRELRDRAGALEACRRGFHIEPRWRASNEDLPAHAAIQAIVDNRRREVRDTFGAEREGGDEIVFRQYPARSTLEIDNVDWEARERLSLKLDGREVVGGGMHASFSRSRLC